MSELELSILLLLALFVSVAIIVGIVTNKRNNELYVVLFTALTIVDLVAFSQFIRINDMLIAIGWLIASVFSAFTLVLYLIQCVKKSCIVVRLEEGEVIKCD